MRTDRRSVDNCWYSNKDKQKKKKKKKEKRKKRSLRKHVY